MATTTQTTHTLEEVRAYCQDLLGQKSGGVVHEYERLVRTEQDLLDIAGVRNERGNYEIHGWTITAETDSADSDVSIDDTPDFTFVRNYTMVFRGFFGLADKQATGRLWQDTIEKVLDGFDADPLLGGTANWTPPIAGRVRDQHREYGNYMVHCCELVLIVRLRRDRV